MGWDGIVLDGVGWNGMERNIVERSARELNGKSFDWNGMA